MMRTRLLSLVLCTWSLCMWAGQVQFTQSDLQLGEGLSVVRDGFTLQYDYKIVANRELHNGMLIAPEDITITKVEVQAEYFVDICLKSVWGSTSWTGSAKNIDIACIYWGDITIICDYREPTEDELAAKTVINLIKTIPATIEANDACHDAITAARDAYDALTEAQKALVTNYSTLTAAEQAYAEALELQQRCTTITWGTDEFATLPASLSMGEHITMNGITLTVNEGCNGDNCNIVYGYPAYSQMGFVAVSGSNAFTFSTELGYFRQIKLTVFWNNGALGEGWDGTTWTGNASSVNFGRVDNGTTMITGATFMIEAIGTPTDLENVQSDNVQCTKVLRDGQLFIIRDGKTYNAQGAVVK